MQEVYDFMKEAEYYFLATIDGDQPRVRPFATYAIFEGKFYIQTGKKKSVSKQIAANPKIEICAFKDDEWLRIAAETAEDNRAETQQYLLEQFPHLKDIGYAVNDGNMNVLYLKNATATFTNHKGVAKVVEF